MAPTATNTASTATATSAAAAAATSSASTSSLPTSLEEATQRYHSTKLTLRTGLANKRLIDRSLIDLESQIYLFEGSYLQTTSSSGGNIVKGFDSYLKNSSSSSTSRGGNQGSLGAEVPVEDRIFSLSSATYQKSLELKANEGLLEEETKTGELESDTSATPVVKKKKDKEAMQSGSKDSAVKKKKDKERSQTPQVGKTGGKNADAGANATTAGGSTPTKSTTGGGGKASSAAAGGGGTATKLKRKNTDGAAAAGSSGVSTPSGKAVKRKKDDD